MRKILASEVGVTLLEGIVALGLLALVAGGAFGVLLSASRQNTQPDIREEMVWAVEKAHDKLKAYVGANLVSDTLPNDLKHGLCGSRVPQIVDDTPLSTASSHNIKCLLPPICDKNNDSSFTYTINTQTLDKISGGETEFDNQGYTVVFQIQCNGYKL